MERSTWDHINELFEAARKLPAAEREAWVRAATPDAHVQSEVLSLLHAHEDDPWFVDEPAGRRTPARLTPAGAWPGKPTPAGPTPAGPTPAPDRQAPSPTPAGPTPAGPTPPPRGPEPAAGGQFAGYRLIREIARDPMRITFEGMAISSTAHPRVTLHVLTADTGNPAVPALLRAGGNILARFDHPGLVRLLNGGVTEDGTAYLVFEHTAGSPIDAWCREHNLDVRGRLQLALAACDGVEHAHQHLAVHGDLRSANVIVSADGQVKLLDTGLAPLLAVVSGQGAAAPVHHAMSPEQARGDVLTTASDVYALGVLIYTLLTGYPPYEIAGVVPARARQMICEMEPDLPSAVAGERERRVFAGTLDRIIMKALRKSPRERYATAGALAADLRAWCDGRPVSVSPPTLWSGITGTRSIRPARMVVTAVILALLAGVGSLGWQVYWLRSELDQALGNVGQATRAQRAIKTAADEKAARRPPTADLRLEIAKATIDLALAERGRYDLKKAEGLWTQALSDLRPLLDGESADPRALAAAADVRASLGSLCRSQGRFEEALAHYREALRARERLAAAPGAPASASLALADARMRVARLLLDLVELRQPGPTDAGRLREANALLAQAGPVLRAATPASPEQQDARGELDRQADRLRRLTARRLPRPAPPATQAVPR